MRRVVQIDSLSALVPERSYIRGVRSREPMPLSSADTLDRTRGRLFDRCDETCTKFTDRVSSTWNRDPQFAHLKIWRSSVAAATRLLESSSSASSRINSVLPQFVQANSMITPAPGARARARSMKCASLRASHVLRVRARPSPGEYSAISVSAKRSTKQCQRFCDRYFLRAPYTIPSPVRPRSIVAGSGLCVVESGWNPYRID